nr:hypothetical protein [Alteromonas lipolytica]
MVPPPGLNLTRFYGVFAANANVRDRSDCFSARKE